jgi:antirestriction protein
MGRASITELKLILDQVNDLSIADDKAKALEAFIGQSVEIITNMSSPHDDFFEGRKKLALDDLQNHSSRHLKGYWQEKEKIEKISEFSRARSEASQAINSILASFKR